MSDNNSTRTPSDSQSLNELLENPAFKFARQRLARWQDYKADDLKVGAWDDALDGIAVMLAIIDRLTAPADPAIADELAKQGLRRASIVDGEPGWYVMTAFGRVWATDAALDEGEA